MVFSSFPVYIDHPNLHQLQLQDQQQGSGIENPQLPPLPVSGGGGGDGGVGSIRPGSMVDRARMAKIPLPEAGIKCPRCDSTNTKFCYFNNYNLSQPRHFCKTCRRYWTRGGALRNVPVGGGCRKNKRSKGNNSTSKSSSSNDNRQMGANVTRVSSSSCNTHMADHLPHMASFQNLTHYGGGMNSASSNGGFQPPQMVATGGSGLTDMGFNLSASGGGEHWKLLSLAGFEPSMNLFPFQNDGVEIPSTLMGGDNRLPPPTGSTSGISQMATHKMEPNNQESNSTSKHFLGASTNNQHWATNSWTGFSSTSNLL